MACLGENERLKEHLFARHKIGKQGILSTRAQGTVGYRCRDGTKMAPLGMLALQKGDQRIQGIIYHMLERLRLPKRSLDGLHTQQNLPALVNR